MTHLSTCVPIGISSLPLSDPDMFPARVSPYFLSFVDDLVTRQRARMCWSPLLPPGGLDPADLRFDT